MSRRLMIPVSVLNEKIHEIVRDQRDDSMGDDYRRACGIAVQILRGTVNRNAEWVEQGRGGNEAQRERTA